MSYKNDVTFQTDLIYQFQFLFAGSNSRKEFWIIFVFSRDKPPTREEAISLFQKCCDELQRRFMVNLPLFRCKIVSKDGIEELPIVKAKAF